MCVNGENNSRGARTRLAQLLYRSTGGFRRVFISERAEERSVIVTSLYVFVCLYV